MKVKPSRMVFNDNCTQSHYEIQHQMLVQCLFPNMPCICQRMTAIARVCCIIVQYGVNV